jgi:hypothetical protein
MDPFANELPRDCREYGAMRSIVSGSEASSCCYRQLKDNY